MSGPEMATIARRAGLHPADAPGADNAACHGVDPEIFFPPSGGDPKEAKRVCASCPLQAPCAEWAIPRGALFGVWGGLTALDRREERERRRAAA